MWIVYVIQYNVSRSIYIGKTNNLKRRILEHNSGENYSTKRLTGKWILIYAEAYRTKSDADKREARLKHHGSAKHELTKRIKESKL